MTKTCTEKDCRNKAYARGYCSKDYMRLYRRGLIKVKRADKTGTWGKWGPNKAGYIMRTRIGTSGKTEYQWQHRYVMEKSLGRKLRKGETVHHKNGVRSDNQLSNLELWVMKQPRGQRPADLVAWAKEILALYPEFG